MFADQIPLILFAKAPVEGKVKTRLTPTLTAKQATQVAEVLLEETIKLARQSWPGDIVLAVWPTLDHPFIRYLSRKYKVECILQGSGDLGAKMLQAMQSKGYPCAVMGCDVPHCKPVVLTQAFQVLQESESVIGLTSDGGYYLLGLQRSYPAIFQSIAWGSDLVSKQTLKIARQEQLVFHQLSQLNDIDEYQDLVDASSQVPALAQLLADAKLRA